MEMFRAFNMGIGLIVVCDADHSHDVLAQLASAGEREARIIGAVTSGDRAIRYVPSL
jgi:phosphoribosylaminoimidazole (AIR) synthetase